MRQTPRPSLMGTMLETTRGSVNIIRVKFLMASVSLSDSC